MNHSSQSDVIEATVQNGSATSHGDSNLNQCRSISANRQKDVNVIDAHVVLLINYIRPHHVAALQEIQRRVRKLSILLSIPMEPDREWDATWGELDVVVQKNRMFTVNWRHSSGFSENNFIHVPTDTTSQLKRLNPDIILSYEMGMRTLLCSWYRLRNRKCKLVMVGNMSEHIETERGPIRRSFRRIIKRGCDFFTHNGPSCHRYLKSIGIPEDRLYHFPYCIDDTTVYHGKRERPNETVRKMLYCGSMSQRKGILQFAQAASNWCQRNSDQTIELSIAGKGELQPQIADLKSENFQIKFLGNCNQAELKDAYRSSDLCVFPSLADEWGLVPIEAMASGLPVLGSEFAQSVETHVHEGKSGWIFQPQEAAQIEAAIDRAMQTSPEQLLRMGEAAKQSVADVSAAGSAEKICELLKRLAPKSTYKEEDF